MATVRQRKTADGAPGRWAWRFKVRNGTTADGKPKYKYVERGGYNTKKEALEAGFQAEREWHTRLSIWEPRQVLYGQLLIEWKMDWCNVHYKGSTLDSVKKDINLVGRYLGGLYIHQLTPKELQEVINDLAARHYSRSRLGKVKGVMYRSLRWAVQQGMIRTNPAEAVSLPAPRAASRMGCSAPREMRALTREEAEAVINRFAGGTAYIPLLLGYRAGLRLGEVFGLEEEDFDPETRCISVRQQLGYHGSDLYITEPKYESSRVVQLDDETACIVEAHIQRIRALRSVGGESYYRYYVDSTGRLSSTPGPREVHLLNVRADGTGHICTPRIMQHVGRVVHGCEGNFDWVDEHGEKNVHVPIYDWDFHMMRHTHISELVEYSAKTGAPTIEEISRRVGHKHVDTTYRYYVHATEETRAAAADAIQRMYGERE